MNFFFIIGTFIFFIFLTKNEITDEELIFNNIRNYGLKKLNILKNFSKKNFFDIKKKIENSFLGVKNCGKCLDKNCGTKLQEISSKKKTFLKILQSTFKKCYNSLECNEICKKII